MSLLREASEVSANCLFLALPQGAWEQVQKKPGSFLDVPNSPVLYAPEVSGGYAFRGLTIQEDVADALRLLLGEGDGPEPEVPFVATRASALPIDEAVGQPTPLEGQAWYLPPLEARRAAMSLTSVTAQDLASRFNPKELEDAGLAKVTDDLDHLTPWTDDDLPSLQRAYAELVAYFQRAAERHEGVLLLLEDGPVSALDLSLECP